MSAHAAVLFAAGLVAALPVAGLGAATLAESDPASSSAAPTQPPPAQPYGQMLAAMGMADAAATGKVMLEQLELDSGDAQTQAAWDAQAWYGTDYDKLWLKSEGGGFGSVGTAGRYEALWDHALLRWWDTQVGVRYDLGQGPARGWLAFGLQGLAPYVYEVEATLYLAAAGRTAARFKTEHDFLFTQRLILQSELETNLYARSDPARDVGAGVSNLQLALRLRYEIRRELAPYLGVVWRRDFGDSAQLIRASGSEPDVLQWIAGVHVWL